MSERKFTKLLKSSLSDSAAKTRENVSRELRQSLTTNSMKLSSIDSNYESFVRELESDFDSRLCFPENDIKCETIDNRNTNEFCYRYLCNDLTRISSLFSRECCVHYTSDKKHSIVSFNSCQQYFGSVFDNLFKTNFELKAHVFECDQMEPELEHVINECNCCWNGINGWLTITRSRDSRFLNLFKDYKKEKMIFSVEVVDHVIPRENGFQSNSHAIEIEDNSRKEGIIRELNENIVKKHELKSEGILQNEQDAFIESIHQDTINLFCTYAQLFSNKGQFIRLKDSNIINNCLDTNYDKNVFKFVVVFEKLVFDSNKVFETFFSRISLFDSKSGKISENFYISHDSQSNGERQSRDSGRGFDEQWVSRANKALFTVDLNKSQTNDLYLVLRIEKSSHPNRKHFEPYVWSARPVFEPDSSTLDRSSSFFGPFYRQDTNRLSDDFITNHLNCNQFSNSLKNNSLISGKFFIKMIDFEPKLDMVQLNSMLFPIISTSQINTNDKNMVQSGGGGGGPLIHVQPLDLAPKTNQEFLNILYIYPKNLRFDSQKVFSKARNILVSVSVLDNDSPDAQPLPVIFGRPHESHMFVTSTVCAVSRHHVTPEFYEEIKIAVPLDLGEKHHVLFTLSHVSCKKDICQKSGIGFAWLPLQKLIHSTDTSLSVFAPPLPRGYLSCQSLGLGHGLSMPEVKHVGKDLFRVSLKLVSTVISRDQTLHMTMSQVCRITCSKRDDSREISRLVSSENYLRKQLKTFVNSFDFKELIRFSQIVFKHMFRLLVHAHNNELLLETLQTIVALVNALQHEPQVLLDFVDTCFVTCHFGDVLFHEQLIRITNKWLQTMTTSGNNDNNDCKLLLENIWFLFRIEIKACVQYLYENNKLDARVKRETRFSPEFHQQLQSLVHSLSAVIVSHSREDSAIVGNRALSHFITRMTSFMDRGFVFNLFDFYLKAFSQSRDVVLNEMRLNSLAIFVAHEHHVALNNPTYDDTSRAINTTIDSDFCEKHFSISLLLNELKHSLSQSVRHVRHVSLQIVRNLLAKHSFDPRYESRELQSRVVSLYLPLIEIIMEIVSKLDSKQVSAVITSGGFSRDHVRHNSLPVRFDCFNSEEINDLLICFLAIVGHVTRKQLMALSARQLNQMFVCLEICLQCFEYKPKTCLKSTENCFRSKTLPNNALSSSLLSQDFFQTYLYSQNISIQSSLIVLRTIHLYTTSTIALRGEHVVDHVAIMQHIMHVTISMLTLPQSESVLIHLFKMLAYFVRNFPQILSQFYSQLISKIIHFSNSRLIDIRSNAIHLLFCFFGADFKRTRFETIVCVSRLASSECDLCAFQRSLSRFESLSRAIPDPSNYEQIVSRIRDILSATQQIRENAHNYHENCELRLRLANSYAQTSRSLRRTWIENLNEVHVKNGDWAESAMCLCHVIAILIEQLRVNGVHVLDGLTHVCRVTDNIRVEEEIEDSSLEDTSHVTLESLELLITECVQTLEKAELFEMAPNVLKVLVTNFEKDFKHEKLAAIYTTIARMHARALEINNSGKRLFDTFFLVSFFGLKTSQHIYKEQKVVSLAEMTNKMQVQYPNAVFLTDIPDPNTQLDTNKLSILITHVTPFVENTRNEFERNARVNRFVFEQRLRTKDDAQNMAQTVDNTYKKRVILTTEHSFPFCLRRIHVTAREEIILSPIEVAIDEMRERVRQLEKVVQSRDAKHLQLILQGSVYVTVNCGPIAYAKAFLQQNTQHNVHKERQQDLRQLFEQFLQLCEKALKLNEKLIKSNQYEYHVNLKTNFEKLKSELNLELFRDKRTSVQIFDVISGTSVA